MKPCTPWIVAIGLFVAAGLILPRIVLTIFKCTPYKYVVNIGACDKYGYCGVKFSDDSFGQQHLPIIGQEACSK